MKKVQKELNEKRGERRCKFLFSVKNNILMLLIGLVLLIGSVFFKNYEISSLRPELYYKPSYISHSESGYMAVVCKEAIVCYADNISRISYILHAKNNGVYTEAVFDDLDNLYTNYVQYDKNGVKVIKETIQKYSPSGKLIGELVVYDYTEENNYDGQIRGLQFYEDKLSYCYLEKDGSLRIMEMNIGEKQSFFDETASLSAPENLLFSNAFPDFEGGYIAQTNSADLYDISDVSNISCIYTNNFDIKKEVEDVLPKNVAVYDGEVFVQDWMNSLYIYKLCEDGSMNPYIVRWIEDYISENSLGINADREGLYMFSNYATSMRDKDGNIRVLKFDGAKATVRIICYVILNYLLKILGLIGVVLAVIFLVGNLMHWHFSLLSKQLFVIIPIVVIMMYFVIVFMCNHIRESYMESIEQEMVALVEIISDGINPEELRDCTSMENVRDGSYNQIRDKMLGIFTDDHKDWSKNLFLCLKYVEKAPDRDNTYYLYDYINSNNCNPPFTSCRMSSFALEDVFHEHSNTALLSSMINGVDTYKLAITPLYYEDGTYEFTIELYSNFSGINQSIQELKIKAVMRILIFLLVLIFAVVMLSMLNMRYLKKARNVVRDISNGNFSTRIKKFPKDEVGEICHGVNDMANHLEYYFEEKDRNEKFYYKFVPEKFRELLHKKEFTDLNLGDAVSMDMTVLFCDIRSFSLNSEMMTAKENFEFVNIIYGIAGPIIRKYNGFVDKYIGDAIMALFEYADDAVAAGIEMYREIVLNPITAQRLKVSSINIGIGVHSGMARIGIVGEEERMAGTVIADTVNLASRLETLTKKYKTAMIITKDTLDRMSDPDSLLTRYLGMLQVAGVNEVKAVYEVLDCLEDERKFPRMKNREAFREAIRLFHLGNKEASLALLEQLDTDEEQDPVPNMYIEQIKEKIQVGDDNHNVFVFTRK